MEPKKNFEKLELSSWYQRRDGVVIQITEFTASEKHPYRSNVGSTYVENGNYYIDREDPNFDLVQKVNVCIVDPIQEIKNRLRKSNGEFKMNGYHCYLESPHGSIIFNNCDFSKIINRIDELIDVHYPKFKFCDRVIYREHEYIFHRYRHGDYEECYIFDEVRRIRVNTDKLTKK